MKSILIGLLLAGLTGCSSPKHRSAIIPAPAPIQLMRMPLTLGDTNVLAFVFQHARPSPTFINVHDDENTSVAAGQTVIEATSGRLIELRHSGRRLIQFGVAGARFAIDPNRIFTDAGIRSTLSNHSTYSPAAHRAVQSFATEYLARFALDYEPVIVALHNNSEGALSIHSYQDRGAHVATARAVNVATNRSPDDFFYVTDRRFFKYLKQRNFNVTLQDNAHVPDDGSLSVYFGKKGIPYVNIEAEMSHLDEQIEMVRATREMLDALHLVRRQARDRSRRREEADGKVAVPSIVASRRP